jgi:preprotein translocase subunit SecF
VVRFKGKESPTHSHSPQSKLNLAMKLNVIKNHKIWWTFSTVLILAGIISMIVSTFTPGVNFPLRRGLDFTGGTRLQYELLCDGSTPCKPIDIGEVRKIVEEQGLSNSTVQVVGAKNTGILIKTKDLKVDTRTKLESALSTKIGKFDPKKSQNDTVGPTLGQQLFRTGILAILISFIGILLYLAYRFQFDYAFFAFVALFHDVLLTTGIFSMLGLLADIEIDSLFVVALLTIIGFSVTDTVVIYDRIREVLARHPEQHINQVVDDAVDQTLSRSINTTLTVLLTLFSIFLFGGETLKTFALCLIIGFAAGAYSSIFIASTLLAWWRSRQPQKPSTAMANPEV